jgi:hypothetical protein
VSGWQEFASTPSDSGATDKGEPSKMHPLPLLMILALFVTIAWRESQAKMLLCTATPVPVCGCDEHRFNCSDFATQFEA